MDGLDGLHKASGVEGGIKRKLDSVIPHNYRKGMKSDDVVFFNSGEYKTFFAKSIVAEAKMVEFIKEGGCGKKASAILIDDFNPHYKDIFKYLFK